MELKARAFEAIRQSELWTARVRDLTQQIDKMEAAPRNGKVDTPAPLVESTP